MELSKPEGQGTFKVNAQRVKPYLRGELPTNKVGVVLNDP